MPCSHKLALLFGLLCLASLTTHTAQADTYIVPPDFGVTCLDLGTGKPLWRWTPKRLVRPALSVFGGKLIVTEHAHAVHVDRKPKSVALSPVTGKVRQARWVGTPAKPMVPMRNLVDASGRVFEYQPGYTRHLQLAGGKVVRHLEDFPRELTVLGDLAFFGFSSRNGGAGEVYAVSTKTGRQRWEFAARKFLPGLNPHALTNITSDKKDLYVSVGQVLFSLDPATGRKRWQTKLPQQALRRYDAAWTKIFPAPGGNLLVVVYEDLFLVRTRDGKLLWSFDPGQFATPQTVVHGSRVCLATRPNTKVELSSFSMTGTRRPSMSVVKIQKVGGAYRLTALQRGQVPKGVHVWSHLAPPPPTKRGGERVVLKLANPVIDFKIEIDMGSSLAKGRAVYVKFTDWYEQGTLSVDGKPRAQARLAGAAAPR